RGGADVQRHARANPPDREPVAEEAAEPRRGAEAPRRRLIARSRRLRAARPASAAPFKRPSPPADDALMFEVTQALRELVDKNGSDLHRKVGPGPLYRVNGELALEPTAEPLSAADTEGALKQLLRDEAKLREFAEEHEVDFSYEIPQVARYRI